VELTKEKLFETSTNLVESNKEVIILKDSAILKDMHSTIEDKQTEK
jgi:hypothetical protein